MIPQNLDPILVFRRTRGVTEVYGRNKNLPRNSPQKKNRVKELREDLLLSRAELAKRAGLSAVTVHRLEKGRSCRMSTKRKILLALGCKLEDKDWVFAPSRARSGS